MYTWVQFPVKTRHQMKSDILEQELRVPNVGAGE